MNADFEMELANPPGRKYLRDLNVEKINQRLAPNLIWLANKGDFLLLEKPWSKNAIKLAEEKQVTLITPQSEVKCLDTTFTPWGWAASAIALGNKLEAIVNSPSLELIAKINSKLFSFQLEKEWGIAMPKAAIASCFEELEEVIARACPCPEDKWVIKSPMGVAARERILGRGSKLTSAAKIWLERKFQLGESLIFQPWLEVVREYGVNFYILPDGKVEMAGVSDLQTNGAGTGKGYLFGRKIDPTRLANLEDIAEKVAKRLFVEGYIGPVGVDALEHKGGFHPLLEINARYTMGFVAVAVEKFSNNVECKFWDTKLAY